MDLNQLVSGGNTTNTVVPMTKDQILAKFKALGGVTYQTTSIWKVVSEFLPVVNIDGEMFRLMKDAYGWQIQMNLGEIAFAEVAKDDRPAAANGYPNWKIEVAIAESDYRAVALSNGTIVTVEEFEKNKVALEAAGITKTATTPDGKPRADGGDIFVPKFDVNRPANEQPKSVKFIASKI